MRDRPSFQHRLLIRIETNESNQTLTITDLGSGMTRSDVINTLGAGSRLSSRAIHASRILDGISGVGGKKSGSNGLEYSDDNDDDSTISGEVSVSSDASSSTDESGNDAVNDIAGIDITDAEADAEKASGVTNEDDQGQHVIKVPAQAKDIGSFYAAMCALGEWVEIGTKVSSLRVVLKIIYILLQYCQLMYILF